MWKEILICLVLMQVTISASTKYDKFSDDNSNNVSTASKDRGISAWALIFLILLFIFIIVSIYYTVIFYPILCKKERNYDRMELAEV